MSTLISDNANASRMNTLRVVSGRLVGTSHTSINTVFRKDLGTFLRMYDFLSQIVPYCDADLEKLYV